MDYVIGILIGYLLGSIPCGLVLVKAVCGIDIRDYATTLAPPTFSVRWGLGWLPSCFWGIWAREHWPYA